MAMGRLLRLETASNFDQPAFAVLDKFPRLAQSERLLEQPADLADDAAAERQYADHEDGALHHDHPAAERRQVILQPDHKVGRSEEHTSELQSLMRISSAVFCLQ